MSDSVFFEWVEVEGFRGFSERQRIDLNASVVILAGPNGAGKTSFFDALQWLLIGSLERLRPWRVRRTVDHVVNQYTAAAGGQATVSAGIRINGRPIQLRRSGRHDRSTFEWRDGGMALYEGDAERELAKALVRSGRVPLERALLSSGLLQQDIIRNGLEDKPTERYNLLAAILGLDVIADFPIAAKKRVDRIVKDGGDIRKAAVDLEAEARKVRTDLSTLRERAKQAPDTTTLRNQIAQRVNEYGQIVRLLGEIPLTAEDAEQLQAVAGLGADALMRLLAEIERVPEVTAAPQDLDVLKRTLEAAQAATAQAREAVAEAEKLYDNERRISSQISRLATEAIPMLGVNCPVCEQQIDAEQVRPHLEKVAAEGSSGLAEHKQKCDQAIADFTKRQADEAQASKALAEAEQVAQALLQRKAWHSKVTTTLEELDKHFALQQKGALAEGNLEAMRAAHAAIAAIADAAKEFTTAFAWVRESAAVSATQTQLADIKTRMLEAHELASKTMNTEEEARILQRAAVRASASITDKRFATLHPVIQDIYMRLDPHPTFTSLKFAVGVYRERGIANPQVTDFDQDIRANPMLIFSSAQTNIVALSAFLALGWAAGEDALPFLLLDDPLQSLDDVHCLGFADLCRHMRTRRQLIVSTHDSRFGKLLERKLAPRRAGDRTRSLNFVAWSRRGPEIDSVDVEPQIEEGARRALLPAAGMGTPGLEPAASHV